MKKKLLLHNMEKSGAIRADSEHLVYPMRKNGGSERKNRASGIPDEVLWK